MAQGLAIVYGLPMPLSVMQFHALRSQKLCRSQNDGMDHPCSTLKVFFHPNRMHGGIISLAKWSDAKEHA